MEPIVTIITATSDLIKNKRKKEFLQMVSSIKKQSYCNIEHIIIDNNSKDGTVELFKQENLKYISEPDTGIFNAYNKGVKLANGKYIMFLSSDDFYHDPKGIEKTVEFIENNNIQYCYSTCNLKIDSTLTLKWKPDFYNIFRLMPACHQTIMCTKDLLIKYPFDENLKIIADYKWVMTLFLNKIPSAQSSCNFVTFRLFGKSSTETENAIKETKQVYKDIFKDIYELSDEEIDIVLKTAVFPEELEEKLSERFEDKSRFVEARNEAKAFRMQIIPENSLTCDIRKRETENNKEIIENLLENYKNLLADINKYLYKKLSTNDKSTFIDFFLKSFAVIDTITKEDEEFLNKAFEETYKLYQRRENTEDFIPVVYFDKQAKLISPTPIYKERPSKEQELLSYYEYAQTYIVTEYLLEGFEPQNGQTILDCGASIGDTAVFFKLRYPESPLFAIECDDRNFNYLNKNIKINQYKDVFPIKTFLSEKNTKTTLTIDEIVKKHNIKNIGLIKFDIEGAEIQALKGSIKTIKEQKPILIIPIYHLNDDCQKIPVFLDELEMPMEIRLKWVERRVWGMDCTLFVKFI